MSLTSRSPNTLTMKTVVAVLFAALAVANAGLIAAPLAAPWAAPAVATQYAALTVGGVPVAGTANIASLAAPLAAHAIAAPIAAPLAAPLAAHIAAPLAAPVAVGAGYTAVTRGAVHSAPLPGHAIGSLQVNVQPAPGTL